MLKGKDQGTCMIDIQHYIIFAQQAYLRVYIAEKKKETEHPKALIKH